MKRKVIATALAIGMILSMAGCGSDKLSNEVMTLNQYKGLKVEVLSMEVTDADVDASIQSTMDAMELGKEVKVKDRGAQYGDTIVMDYTGKKDGVEFEGGAAKDHEGVLGSIGFIEGFESSIVGHKAGETFDINVTFPENYQSPDLAGQPAVFTIVLKSVKTTEYPELTDDVATKLNGEKITVDEYKKKVREDLEVSNAQTAQDAMEENAWAALIEQCVVDAYPAEALEEKKKEIESRYSSIVSYYGMDINTFVQNYFGVSVENMAKDLLKKDYAIDLIVEAEGLEVSAEEYQEGLKKYAEENGYDSTNAESLASFEKLVTKSVMKDIVLEGKVTKVLIDNCEKVEAK